VEVSEDEEDALLVKVDVGGSAVVLSRVTASAVSELGLREGVEVWVLVKAVSTRGHAFRLAAR
jgi:molybdopterin-binding protein